MERREFSKGFHAIVSRVSPEDKKHFEAADLVREVEHFSSGLEQDHFKLLFYSHKVASLLFPNNFITVVGAKRGDERSLRGKPHSLFSKDAQIDPDHATYASHMDFYEDEGKVSICRCDACQRHKIYHRKNGLKDRARELADQTRKVGIALPVDDPSDYCCTLGEGIIFFEFDGFNGERVEEYLENRRELNSRENRALSLVKRYNVLYRQSHPYMTQRTFEDYIL